MSRDFRPFFGLKDLTWAPYEQAKTVLWAFSFSRRYSIAKFKICVYAYTMWTRKCFSRYGCFILFNYCYWVCKHTQVLFSPDCSFKIWKKPSKFSESIRVVLSVCSTPHRVRVVIDYAMPCNIASTSQRLFQPLSALSTTMLSQCQRSQRLRPHANLKISNYIFC